MKNNLFRRKIDQNTDTPKNKWSKNNFGKNTDKIMKIHPEILSSPTNQEEKINFGKIPIKSWKYNLKY